MRTTRLPVSRAVLEVVSGLRAFFYNAKDQSMSHQNSFWNPCTVCLIAGGLLAVPQFGLLPLLGVAAGLAAMAALRRRRSATAFHRK
jgi:hypothetical protein